VDARVGSALQQLAAALLEDVERIAKRSVARMQELLPGYGEVPPEALLPVTLTNTRNLLEAVLDPGADPSRAEDHFLVSGETRVGQGISADDLLQAWRIGVESIREEAHSVASRLGIADDVLLEFVEATLQWGDIGMRTSAQAHRKAEIRELERLAAEQAALRRVATLVAQGAAPEDVFAAVNLEVATLLPVTSAAMGRFAPDGTCATVAAWSASSGIAFPVGDRWDCSGNHVTGIVLRTGRPARLDDFSLASGPIGVQARDAGYRSAVGSPIMVEGRLWGVMSAASTMADPLPAGTETRLASFTALVATAIANAQARAETRILSDEQAALRRVAELVAREATQSEVFTGIAVEIVELLGADEMRMMRYEGEREAVVAAAAGHRDDVFPVASRWPLGGENITSRVFRTGKPARIEYGPAVSGRIGEVLLSKGIRVAVGTPILVQGQMWGAMLAMTFSDERLPAGTELRLSQFTKLMATAVDNAEARAEVERLAEEQAALRRVATLIAQAAPPEEVFAAVAREMRNLVGADLTRIVRLDPDGTATLVGGTGADDRPGPLGPVEPGLATAEVLRTGRTARIDDYAGFSPELVARWLGATGSAPTAVASPVIVAGHIWGTILAAALDRPLPEQTELRMADFTELLAIAIANASSRSELAASRARLVVAGDEARRRFERNLHDGVQQRLVSLALRLRRIERRVPGEDRELKTALSETVQELNATSDEVREIAQGIHPAILTQGGLAPALRSLALRSPMPVEVVVDREERLPEPVEVAAYYVAAEALTNAAKHAAARRAWVIARHDDGVLHLRIRDDGVGGADPSTGSGLTGIRDRVEALGGSLAVRSPHGEGTALDVTLPLVSVADRPGASG
jgi:signal transduction histidine kinase